MQPPSSDLPAGPAGAPEVVLDPVALVGALMNIADGAAVGVTLQRADGRYLQVNAEFGAIIGRSPGQVTGSRCSEWLAPETAGLLQQAEARALQGDGPATELHRIDSGSGERTYRVVRQRLAGGTPSAAPVLCCIWTELHHERAAFDAQLEREIALVEREQRDVSLLSIALDAPGGPAARPVEIADPVGDWLRIQVRGLDSVYRLSAERHAVVLSGAGLAVAHARAAALLRLAATAFPGVDLSIGIASCPLTTSGRAALVAAADEALERARRRHDSRLALAPIRFGPLW